MSDAAEFDRLEELFHGALELDDDGRRRLLDGLEDEGLRRRLADLLDEHAETTGVLERSPVVEQRGSATSPVAAVRPGELIAGFRIVDVIASGGMGTVYRAEQEQPRRAVALKVMKAGFASRRALRRFALEAEILGTLRHPGIAQVYDAGLHHGADGEVPYFAMELIDGLPLTEHAERRRLSPPDRLELVLRLCDAVEHAHQRGVVHRDLKPANVLVDADGQPKILDFGVARSTGADVAVTSMHTDVGEVVGTVAYMSPEQARGDPREVDTRSDVYALGVISFELLTGCLPHDLEGKLLHEAIRVVREEEPRSLEAIDRRLRGDVQTIVSKALETAKERRYATASALASDIRRYLIREPIEARPPSAAYRMGKLVQRHRVLALVTGLVVIGLVTGIVLVGAEARRADRQAARAEREAMAKGAALAELTRLSDVELVRQFTEQADELFPAVPERADDMRRWLEKSGALVSRIPEHEATLAELRAAATAEVASGADGAVDYRFRDVADRWHHGVLEELVEELRRFADPESGIVAAVRRRLAIAEDVRRRSIDEQAAAWERASAEVAASASYPDDVTLVPQLGLVPLGADPVSGLQEFLHLETHEGEVPRRAADGALPFGHGTGIVFVLLPGGPFALGAQRDDPAAPRHDPQARPREGPVEEVRLDPFFVSRYEMTQGQWQRARRANPSFFRPGAARGGVSFTLQHPVELVSWDACRETMRRLDLELPTEAQWEYAARGGRDDPWWTGPERERLLGRVNLIDQAAVRDGIDNPMAKEFPDLDDGYSVHAPVTTFPPNAFGLHHVIGNVSEWTRDCYADYPNTTSRPGDGLRVGKSTPMRIARGGSHVAPPSLARVSIRMDFAPKTAANFLGLRPVRPLRPEGK